MNYSTVQEIIDAGITNCTTLVNNTKYDDNYYTISNPPSWILFNGLSVSELYVSGNSFIGIEGPTVENIKFNRRDTAMWYLYSEVGTYMNSVDFYRLRWKGYSRHSATGTSYAQEWEVIFFRNGDLMIHACVVPTNNYDGTFQLVAATTYVYTAPTAATPYVSFYTDDYWHRTFTFDYNIITVRPVFDVKYLLKDATKYYTIVDDELQEITVTTLTASVFEEYGVDDLPSDELISTLTNPSVLYWQDSSTADLPTLKATVNAIPPTQVIISDNIDFSGDYRTGIKNMVVDSSDDVLIAVSLDDGVTWKKHDTAEWLDVTSSQDGMSIEITNWILTAMWQRFVGSNTHIKVRFTLFEDSYLNSIIINYTYE